MWHETEDEQLEMLKSLFRIDSDYHRRKMANSDGNIYNEVVWFSQIHILF